MPTAVFAFNDRSALGVLDTLIRAGVGVPDEAVCRVIERLDGVPAATGDDVCPPHLVLRGSTAPPH